MTLDNCCLHAIDTYGKNNPFDIELTLIKLEEILSSGYILSKKHIKNTNKRYAGWNGMDYISLCDYSRKNNSPYNNDENYKDYTSFEIYIRDSLSFIFSKDDIKTIDTVLKPPLEYNLKSISEMIELGNHPTKRFSDYPDEVQVKNKISLKKAIGITIPIDRLIDEDCNYTYSREQIIKFLNNTKELLHDYKMRKPIFDLLTMTEIKEDSDLEKVFTKLKDIS